VCECLLCARHCGKSWSRVINKHSPCPWKFPEPVMTYDIQQLEGKSPKSSPNCIFSMDNSIMGFFYIPLFFTFYVYWYLLFHSCGAGDGSQGHAYAKQVLYHWMTSSALGLLREGFPVRDCDCIYASHIAGIVNMHDPTQLFISWDGGLMNFLHGLVLNFDLPDLHCSSR
jgi:hypothetical protein